MSTAGRINQDDDPFTETRMSFGDHIEELRAHLLRAIYGFLIAFAIACFLGQPVVEFIARPVEVALKKYWKVYYNRKAAEIRQDARNGRLAALPPSITTIEVPRWFAEGRKKAEAAKATPLNIVPGIAGLVDSLRIPGLIDHKVLTEDEWVSVSVKMPNSVERIIDDKIFQLEHLDPMGLKTLSATEAFLVYFKVCAFVGLVLGGPWVLWQIWSFIAVGLYPQEKRYVYSYFPISVGLFLAGVLACEFFILPQAIEALLWFNSYLNMQPDFRLSEWLTFALLMPLVFGVCFQTPLVMLLLNRLGVVSVQTYRKGRRYAIFFLAVFATIILPTPDIWTMLSLTITLCLFYEVGIWMCLWSPEKPLFAAGTEQSNELVEV
jgi:sec-independent protein translocase protein TatC